MTVLSSIMASSSSGALLPPHAGLVSALPFQPHWDLFPAFYVAPRAPTTSYSLSDNINGDLTKTAWAAAPWSSAFGDIQGKDAPNNNNNTNNTLIKPATTRFKALWDNEYLYIGAILYPSPDFNTQAHFTERNSPIYQTDSDFEVFVDGFQHANNNGANIQNHNYKELEINAINTVWNLMLDKPYLNNGQEHSGRIAKPGDDLYYDVLHQKTAVQVLQGTLNNNNGGGTGALWSVEMALSFADLKAIVPDQEGAATITPSTTPPVLPGSTVRINFSRVELQGDINWTWQPQRVWNVNERRYAGQVNMHLPESWGYLVFGGTADEDDDSSSEAAANEDTATASKSLQPCDIDPTWPAQVAAMHVYYAQQYHFKQTGAYTFDLTQLAPYMELAYINPFTVHIVRNNWVKDGFRVIVADQIGGIAVTVEQDRLLKIMTADDALDLLEDSVTERSDKK